MLKAFIKTVRNCAFDGFRYARYSGALIGGKNRDILRAHILMDTHRIEKGMALPTPRPGFGQDVLARLFTAIRQYEIGGSADFATEWSRGVMRRYCEFNAALDCPTTEVDAFLKGYAVPETVGGLIELRPAGKCANAGAAFEQIAMSRHSVRQFAQTPVDTMLIDKAVKIASKTPSVCNRQSGRLHHVIHPEKKRTALEIQGGNRGFGDDIPELFIVTSDMVNFLTSAERYQSWIDGGLFAMSVVYALHSLGLGTCMLNWSVDMSRDVALRKVVEVPPSHNIICFIAFGHLPDTLHVAASPRYPLDQFITRHA